MSKTIYLDSDFRCYTEPGEGREAFETEAFDGYCDSYINGFRLVPAGKSWTRDDGEVFHGEMVSPAIPFEPLQMAQVEYERYQSEKAQLETAYREGVNSI